MSSANLRTNPSSKGRPLYQSVFDLLDDKIRSNELSDGTNLREGSLANVLGLSRAPVRRALELLYDKGMIRPADGQGYVVGKTGKLTRLDFQQLGAILSDLPAQEVARSTAWERIYDDIRHEVTACLPFGTYRISEAKVGQYFSVSRTVVREVLGRLMDRGLIEKDRRSHWFAGPLTARDIHEKFELRRLLEPAALAQSAPYIDNDMLKEMRARVADVENKFDDATPEQIETLEDDLHRGLLVGLKNKRMLEIVAQNQLPFIVPELFRRHFGLKSDYVIVEEHGLILDQILKGAIDVACSVLEAHLRRSEKNTLAKLRVLSILPKPATAPYLVHAH